MIHTTVRRLAATLLAILLLVLPLPAQNIDFTKGKSHLPFLLGPYTPRFVPQPQLVNSPRIDDLIRDGKLYLSLQDAIYLALENNLDIAAARYGPDIAETDILRTKGGGLARGAGGVGTATALGGGPVGSFDPTVSYSFNWSRRIQPQTSTFLTGTNKLTTTPITNGFTYNQSFQTGTSFSITYDAFRQSTNATRTSFNPFFTSSLQVGFSQRLLNGFGLGPNRRFIRVAKNNQQISDQAFLQQVMETISAVKDAYWELVFAREDVKVKEQSLALAEKLYQDNQRQVEIGTLAPIEVVRAESEVARTRQDLIVSQTTLLQQQITIKDLIARNPMDPLLALVEIIPTEPVEVPELPEVIPVQDAIQIAMEKRPEIIQAQLDLKNRGITRRAVRNSMLPSVDVFGFYSGSGLAGALNPLAEFDPIFNLPPSGEFIGGFSRSFTQAIQRDFPNYGFGVSITIPIKNRAAQADTARAALEERQSEVRYRRTVNQIIRDVRNAQILLQQSRARIDAAEKARLLARETMEAEQKKLQLGASTIFLVIQAQRDLAAAQSLEVRTRVDFKRAQVGFDQALGRTLERSNVKVEDAETGVVTAGLPKFDPARATRARR
ncbi:MAG: TolC family protein [Terriglobia bacterium]